MHTLVIRPSASLRRGERLDFFVSGMPLLRIVEKRYDLIPRLTSSGFCSDSETLDTFLLRKEGDTPSGRVGLYVCPQCEHYGCGVVSTRILRVGHKIVWSDFVWEVDYDDSLLTKFETLGPYEFDEQQYRNALTTAGKLPNL